MDKHITPAATGKQELCVKLEKGTWVDQEKLHPLPTANFINTADMLGLLALAGQPA